MNVSPLASTLATVVPSARDDLPSRARACRHRHRRVRGVDQPDAVIVTHALGSCVAVCLFDPVARVAGMLHFLLPESSSTPERAARQPAAFADTGIPLLFQAAYQPGASKKRCASSWSAAPRSPADRTGSMSAGAMRCRQEAAVAERRARARRGARRNRCAHRQPAGSNGRVQVTRGREVVEEL